MNSKLRIPLCWKASTGDMPPYEFRVLHKDGEPRWALGTVAMLRSPTGDIVGQIATIEDISDRKKMEDALRASEARFKQLATHGPVGICEANAAGECTFFNQGWCNMAGISVEEALRDGWQKAIHPDDLPRMINDWHVAIEARKDAFSGEFRFVRPSGEIVWAEYLCSVVRNTDGSPRLYISKLVDVSGHRDALQKLNDEQKLLRQSIEMMDRERKVFAYDIHDGLIQFATGAYYHLEGWRAQCNSQTDHDALEPVVKALKQTMAEGRRIMNDMSTPVLDRHGITAALEELADERSTNQVHVEFISKHDGLGRLMPDLETALYRISQEGVTNAVKHSKSSRVRVTVDHDEHWVWLEIKDWGVGFKKRAPERGVHGLGGIEERARLLGGKFDLDSNPGAGTCIMVRVPLRRLNAAED